jgi:serine/threonine protein kinase
MTAPADPAAPDPPPPSGSLELGGLDAHQLLKIGLDTVVMPQGLDPDATVPVSQPSPAASGHRQPDLPLPEQLTELLPHGNYLVVGFLGQGGMGAVYKGTQVRLKRPVAIKIMRRDQGRDYDFEARFEREAQAMAKLNHPNIVSVIDFGEAGADYLYIVMELVEGADLMDVIRTGRMTQEMALSLLPQICDALQFAHDHGIVHRDIKPSNIMLTRDGRIKIADFGLAKHFDAESSFRTQTGTGMGTPDYAAPEQFNANAQIDHRADIYALGVMIYQMITGELPRGVWKAPSQRAQVDTQWDDIVSHAMQSDPSDCYQQASEIKTDVSSITLKTAAKSDPSPLGGERLGEGSASRTRKSRIPLFSGIISLAAALAIGAFFGLRPDSSRVSRDGGNVAGMTPTDHALASAATPASPAAQGIAATALPESGWKPLIAAGEWRMDWSGETESQGAKQKSSREFRDGLVHLRNTGIHNLQPSPDGAIRASIVIREGSTNIGVVLRNSSLLGCYKLGIGGSSNGSIVLTHNDAKSGNSVVLARHDLAKPLQTGDKVQIELRVQGNHLTGLFNGAVVAEANDTRLTESGEWSLNATDGWIESVEVQSLPATVAAIKLWDSAEKLPKSRGIRWEDEAMRLDNAGSSSGPDSHNAILRASIRANPDAIGTVLALRMNDAPSTQARLVVHLATGKAGLTTATTGGVGLGEWSLPRAYAADEWVRVELRAIDDDFTVLVDGQVIGTAHSEALSIPGKAMVYAGANGFFRDIEYVPLDKPAASSAPKLPVSAPSTPATSYPQPAQWTDATAGLRSQYLTNGDLVADGEWLKAAATKAFDLKWALQSRNPIVRVVFTDRVAILLRRNMNRQPKNDDTFYQAIVGHEKVAIERRDRGEGPVTILAEKYAPNQLDGAREAVFAAQGDTLTLWLDGRLVATARDGALTSGGLAVILTKGELNGDGRIKKVEYGELPDPAPPSVSPAPNPPVSKSSIAVPALPESGWKPLVNKQEWETDWEGAPVNYGGKLVHPNRRFNKEGLLHMQSTNLYKPSPSPDGAIRVESVIRQLPHVINLGGRRLDGDQGRYTFGISADAKYLLMRFIPKDQAKTQTLQSCTLPTPIKFGDHLKLELRIQGSQITGLWNGVAVLQTQDQRLTAAGEWGLDVVDASIKSVEVQSLPAAAAESWVDAFHDPSGLSFAGQSKPTITLAGMQMNGASGMKLEHGPARDGAVRIRTGMGNGMGTDGNGVSIRGRQSTGNKTFYALKFSDNEARLALVDDESKPGKVLASLTLSPPYQKGQEYELELRIVGDRLTAKLDGKVIGDITDSTLQTGKFGVGCNGGTPPLVKTVEYLNLDKVVSPAPNLPVSQSSDPKFPPGQWVKLFTKAEDLPEELRKPDSGVKFEDGWIRVTPSTKPLVLPDELSGNYGVRLRAIRAEIRTDMALRWQKSSDVADKGLYALQINSNELLFQRLEQDKYFTLHRSRLAELPNIGTEYAFEYGVVGDRVVGRVGTNPAIVTRDERWERGPGYLSATEDLRDIEVINLDGLPEAEALRLLGVDEQGNDLRGKAGAAEVWQNLIPLIKPATHTIKGNWEVKSGELICKASPWALCEIPVDYHGGSYDLRVTVTRGEGEQLALFFPFRKGDAAGDVVFDYFDKFSDGLKRAGLESISRLKEGDPGNVFRMKSEWIPKGKKSTVLLQVRDEGIAVSLNGEEVFRWKADWAQLHQFRGFESALADGLNGRPVFGVGLFSCDATYHSIEMREVTGEEARLLPPAAAAK